MDARRRPGEGVAVGRGQVGDRPDLDDAGHLDISRPTPVDERRPGRVGVERFGERQRLVREQWLRVVLGVVDGQHAIHGDVDGLPRVGARDGPVAASAQARARIRRRWFSLTRTQDAREGVLRRRALGPDQRHGEVAHLRLIAGPERLHVGGHAELGEARHVIGVHELQVGEVVAAGIRRRPGRPVVRGRRCLEGVERLTHGAVADDVHVRAEARRVERDDRDGERLPAHERDAAGML